MKKPIYLIVVLSLFFTQFGISQKDNVEMYSWIRKDLVITKKSNKYGVLRTSDNKIIIPNEYDYINLIHNSTILTDRFFIATINVKDSVFSTSQNKKVLNEYSLSGLFNQEGQTITPVKWKDILLFKNNRARVRDKSNLFGMIDDKGNVILEPKYFTIYEFENGNYAAQLGVTTIFMDKNFNKLRSVDGIDLLRSSTESTCLFKSIYEKQIEVKNGNYKYSYQPEGIIDCFGNVILKGEWREANIITQNIIEIKTPDKIGYYDLNKKAIVIDTIYNSGEVFKTPNGLFFHVANGINNSVYNNEYKCINKYIGSERYKFGSELIFYSTPYANNSPLLWGLIDVKGNIIKKPCWQKFDIHSANVIKAKLTENDSDWKYYDLNGNELNINALKELEAKLKFRNGLPGANPPKN